MQQVKLDAKRPNRTAQFAIVFAHMVVDTYTGALAILLPTLLKNFDLSYTLATSIFTTNLVVIAVAQPLFGLLGDAHSYPWLMFVGCAVTAVAMVSVIFLPSYPLVIAAVMVSGLGSAMFHPEAVSRLRAVSGDNTAGGVSFFFAGGNIGFALGPLLYTLLTLHFNSLAAVFMLLPTIFALILLAANWRVLSEVNIHITATSVRQNTPRVSVGVLVTFLMLIVILRSSTLKGLETFTPLYLLETTTLGQQSIANLLTALSLAGVLGTLFGGVLADRFGRRVTMAMSMALSLVSLYGFLNSSGPIRYALMFLAGACLTTAWPVIVVMIQEALPNRIGLASGLSLGTSYGAQAVVVQLLGVVADGYGLHAVMTMLSVLPVGILLLTFFVPERSATTLPVTISTLEQRVLTRVQKRRT